MATTQKKRGGARTAGGKRTAPKPQASAREKKPIRRETGAGICVALALMGFLGYFGVRAIFIDWFCTLLKGLTGYGFWLYPPCLLLSAYILAFHRGRPVRLCLGCALAIPALLSCILHAILAQPLPWGLELLGELWERGCALASGGVVSGFLGQVGILAFSRLGSTILFGLGLAFCGLRAFRLSFSDVAEWIFNRPAYEPEPEEEETAPPRSLPRRGKREAVEPKQQSTQPPQTPPRRRRSSIDIPFGEEAPVEAASPQPEETPRQEEKPELFAPRKAGSFFNSRARVPAPDALFRGEEEPQEPEEEMTEDPRPSTPKKAEEPAPAPLQLFEAPETPPPEAAEPQEEELPPLTVLPPRPATERREAPESRAAGGKNKRFDAEQAAAEIAMDINAGLQSQDLPYTFPPMDLLLDSGGGMAGEVQGELMANRQSLSDTIRSFGIEANIVDVVRGPSVTRYELELDQGVRLNRLTNLADDIALALGASGVRIAPIPDKKSIVGIEVPNKIVSPVSIRSVIESDRFANSRSKVSFAVGKDISGECIVGDINRLPHLLIAGTTGSGKSVCTNTIITSLLYKATPEDVRLIMVDPKMVELGIYNGIPHLLIPVVTDPKKAAGALQWAVSEMMNRYRVFSEVGVRKLEEYNALAQQREDRKRMPFIVILIDELADLMLVAAKEVEESICRVAQMGRAAGIHLVIATQRPSADVITGLMKANIPSRIAFAVASAMESRIILDTQGAEKLVGRGDMLFAPLGQGKPMRVQGCFISDLEVANVVGFVKENSAKVEYSDEVMHEIEQHAAEKDKGGRNSAASSAPEEPEGEYDELLDAAAEVILETGQASVSMLQRRLKLGYARAARLVDQLEEKGIVGPFEGSKPRQLLITKEQWQERQFRKSMAEASPPSPPPFPEETPPERDSAEVLDRAEEDTL